MNSIQWIWSMGTTPTKWIDIDCLCWKKALRFFVVFFGIWTETSAMELKKINSREQKYEMLISWLNEKNIDNFFKNDNLILDAHEFYFLIVIQILLIFCMLLIHMELWRIWKWKSVLWSSDTFIKETSFRQNIS